jgi:hypothetical protein
MPRADGWPSGSQVRKEILFLFSFEAEIDIIIGVDV